MTDLEIGFRKMKEVLDRKDMDYKDLIFELNDEDENGKRLETDGDKDADEIRLEVSNEILRAIPLMKEEFVEKLVN